MDQRDVAKDGRAAAGGKKVLQLAKEKWSQ